MDIEKLQKRRKRQKGEGVEMLVIFLVRLPGLGFSRVSRKILIFYLL